MVLLGSSAGFAAIMQHDAVGVDYQAAARAPIGSPLRLRGELSPYPYAAPLAGTGIPDGTLAVLDGLVPHEPFRFLLRADGVTFVILSSNDHAAGSIIVSGDLVAHAHVQGLAGPSGIGQSSTPISVVRAQSWTQPILFR